MTTNEYLIKRILDLEKQNETLIHSNASLRETLNSIRDSQAKQQQLINKVSDKIMMHKFEGDNTILLQASSVFDKDLYDTCFELFDLEWREKV